MFGDDQKFCVVPRINVFNDETTQSLPKLQKLFSVESSNRASKFYANRFSFDYNGTLLGKLVALERQKNVLKIFRHMLSIQKSV